MENDEALSLPSLRCGGGDDNSDDDSSITLFSLLLFDEGKRGLRGLIFPPRNSSSAEREGLWS